MMNKKVKITLDTNIIISALFWSGFPRAILEKCIRGDVEVVLSKEILEEVKEVLEREKKFEATTAEIQELLQTLLDCSKIVVPKLKIDIIKDRKDNKILECGKVGKVDYIVTGDKHLLEVKEFKGIKIVRAREIVEMLKN